MTAYASASTSANPQHQFQRSPGADTTGKPSVLGLYLTHPEVSARLRMLARTTDRYEDGFIRELAEFLNETSPPMSNYMSLADQWSASSSDSEREHKWRLLRGSKKKVRTKKASIVRRRRPVSIRLPDSAVAGTTIGGHRHIAISIPNEYYPLTADSAGTQEENAAQPALESNQTPYPRRASGDMDARNSPIRAAPTKSTFDRRESVASERSVDSMLIVPAQKRSSVLTCLSPPSFGHRYSMASASGESHGALTPPSSPVVVYAPSTNFNPSPPRSSAPLSPVRRMNLPLRHSSLQKNQARNNIPMGPDTASLDAILRRNQLHSGLYGHHRRTSSGDHGRPSASVQSLSPSIVTDDMSEPVVGEAVEARSISSIPLLMRDSMSTAFQVTFDGDQGGDDDSSRLDGAATPDTTTDVNRISMQSAQESLIIPLTLEEKRRSRREKVREKKMRDVAAARKSSAHDSLMCDITSLLDSPRQSAITPEPVSLTPEPAPPPMGLTPIMVVTDIKPTTPPLTPVPPKASPDAPPIPPRDPSHRATIHVIPPICISEAPDTSPSKPTGLRPPPIQVPTPTPSSGPTPPPSSDDEGEPDDAETPRASPVPLDRVSLARRREMNAERERERRNSARRSKRLSFTPLPSPRSPIFKAAVQELVSSQMAASEAELEGDMRRLTDSRDALMAALVPLLRDLSYNLNEERNAKRHRGMASRIVSELEGDRDSQCDSYDEMRCRGERAARQRESGHVRQRSGSAGLVSRRESGRRCHPAPASPQRHHRPTPQGDEEVEDDEWIADEGADEVAPLVRQLSIVQRHGHRRYRSRSNSAPKAGDRLTPLGFEYLVSSVGGGSGSPGRMRDPIKEQGGIVVKGGRLDGAEEEFRMF
jgi:hypothetical protein